MQENKQEKSQIKQNILLYLRIKGVSEYRFYKESGITRGILQQPNGISEENISRFLDYANDINIEWLLTGRGEMLKTNFIENNSSKAISSISNCKNDVKTAFSQGTRNENSVNHSKSQGIPLVSVKAVGGFAGKDFLISESDIEAYYVIPKFRNLNVDFMIEVVGDSMMPRLFPGDVIACSIVRNSKIIQWNKTYLIATEDQGMIVKRLKKSTEKDSLLAVSDNSDYDPFDIPLSDITGLARVVGVIHAE